MYKKCKHCTHFNNANCGLYCIGGLDETFYCASFTKRYEQTIGGRIKKLREEKGEIQADVAKKLNVKRETVNQWENNTRDLKTEYTVKLADYYNTTCDYILRGYELAKGGEKQ